MSDIELAQRLNDVSRVKPSTAEMSDIELPPSRSDFRLVAPSSPVKSLMLDVFCFKAGQSRHISRGDCGT